MCGLLLRLPPASRTYHDDRGKDILEAFRSADTRAVCDLVHSDVPGSWPQRHPERYPEADLKRDHYLWLNGIPSFLEKERALEAGFSEGFSVDILFVINHFSDRSAK